MIAMPIDVFSALTGAVTKTVLFEGRNVPPDFLTQFNVDWDMDLQVIDNTDGFRYLGSVKYNLAIKTGEIPKAQAPVVPQPEPPPRRAG